MHEDKKHFPDVALVIEGGGTRNSYTAAVIDKFLEQEVTFGWVGGISAGSSHTVGFLSGDRRRVREAFVEVPAAPQAGGWGSFARGRGYFNAEYIYETSTAPGEPFAVDFDKALSNPTPFAIGSLRADTGAMVYWGHEDVHSAGDLAKRVRASSTMPLIMPMPIIDGVPYIDGALGPTGGVPIDAARSAGFSKFFVLLSQERGYQKAPTSRPALLRRALRKYPAVAEAMISRPERYNATKLELFALEKSGDAYLFCPNSMPVNNRERNLAKLQASFAAGQQQVDQDWPQILKFLEGTAAKPL